MIDGVEWWWKIDGVWRNESNDWWCDNEKIGDGEIINGVVVKLLMLEYN